MDPFSIIEKYYRRDGKAYHFLVEHSKAVRGKALQIAKEAGFEDTNFKFLEEASLLHDIGIVFTDAPHLGCYGDLPYLSHGVAGRDILEKEGHKKHALVCERHVGSGITAKEVKEKALPLPERDMIPVSAEEEIICLADNFFSKSGENPRREESLKEIEESFREHGEESLHRLRELMKKYHIT